MNWAGLFKGDRKGAFLALNELSRELWGSPETSGEIPPLEQRISVSVSKTEQFGIVPCIHVDREDSIAFQKAKAILQDYPFVTTRLGGGEAQAAYPEENTIRAEAITGQLLPGAAISHGRYRFGTLGCIVEAKVDDVFCKCVVTAAHVASLNQGAELGDNMYCPGKGSTPWLKRGYVFGTLAETVELFPLNPKIRGEVEDEADITLDTDVALVKVTDMRPRRLPTETRVPDPADPQKKLIKISGTIPEIRLDDILLQEVFLYGAVSGFSKGVLTDIGINRKVLKLPNRKNYGYRDLIAIAGAGAAFSRPGDSGSIIYTKDGFCVGFLIGADSNVSFGCIGERALAVFEAKIV